MINETELMRQHDRYVAAHKRLGAKTIRSLPAGIERIRIQRELQALDRKSRDYLILEATSAASPEPVSEADTVEPEDAARAILSPFRWKLIIREVCLKHSVKLNEIMSTRRRRNIVDARHEAFYRLKNETSLSLPQIGRMMGGFDHTTVLHGVKRHEARFNTGEKSLKQSQTFTETTVGCRDEDNRPC